MPARGGAIIHPPFPVPDWLQRIPPWYLPETGEKFLIRPLESLR